VKNKARILDLLKDASADVKSMSVGQLVEKLSKELESEKKEEREACEKVCISFKDSYIKVFKHEGGLFGDEVIYVHITNIKPGSFTTDYERTFDIEGYKITFSDKFNNSMYMKFGDTHNCMTSKSLENAEKITVEDYKEAEKQLMAIKSIVDKIKK